jgi:hypothetical protein
MITEADVESGSIDHALAMQIPACDAYVVPADRGDCSGTSADEPSEGTWFRIASGVTMPSHLTPFAQMVFHALQNYGAVVTDKGGAVMIQAESVEDWSASGHTGVDPITASWAGQPEYAVLNGIPWSDLQVIQPPS